MNETRDKGLPMQTATSVRNNEPFGDVEIGAQSAASEMDSERLVLDTSHLIIEDNAPMDNIFTEKQERLLTSPLYASWSGPPVEDGQSPRSFAVMANVGLFYKLHEQAIVPDVMLSLDVQIHPDLSIREHRTYFFWEFGKGPEVVIEIVSNREGGEATEKLQKYRKMRIPYYVIFDPHHHLSQTTLRAYELRGDLYIALPKPYFEMAGMGVVEWTGEHEKLLGTWLRWCTKDGQLIPTAEENTAAERKRADEERKRADEERKRAEQAQQRAEQLEARLRALGVDPTTI